MTAGRAGDCLAVSSHSGPAAAAELEARLAEEGAGEMDVDAEQQQQEEEDVLREK